MVCTQVSRERQGEAIDRSAFRDIIKMLLDLGVNSRAVYEADFENAFLEVSTLFYRQEASQLVSNNTCPEYLRKAQRRLEEEIQRVEQYLDNSTEPKIRETVEREMLLTHMQTLLHMEGSGLVAMISKDQIDGTAPPFSLHVTAVGWFLFLVIVCALSFPFPSPV